MTTPTLEHYLHLFTHLRTDKNRNRWTERTQNRAPHKPFLLLVILDLIEQGSLLVNFIEITPELSELFAMYWRLILPPEKRGNLALPFFHMRSSTFWHLVTIPGYESALENTRQIDSLSQLQKLILGANLDEALFDLLLVESNRNFLRSALIQTYFDQTCHDSLLTQSTMNLQSFVYSQKLIKKVITNASVDDAENQYVRDQGFRKAVVGLYQHRCAMCGIKMLTTEGHTAVEAAHIIPWYISHNDDPRNGISLCRLCHWTFDEGLLSISETYRIMLSKDLQASFNMAGHLTTIEHRPMITPDEKLFWPSLESLSFHRTEIFKR